MFSSLDSWVDTWQQTPTGSVEEVGPVIKPNIELSISGTITLLLLCSHLQSKKGDFIALCVNARHRLNHMSFSHQTGFNPINIHAMNYSYY